MPIIFQRQCKEENADHRIQMPQRILPTTTHQSPIDVLALRLETYQADPSDAHDRHPWAARFVMGIPVPTWALPIVWNVGQQARFITAVWAGADLGSYLTNEWCDHVGNAMANNSEILIDGQQRLHSLEEYFLDRLAVPDAQGQPRIWSEVGNSERKRFLSTVFTHSQVSSGNEVALRNTYDLCAMGVPPRAHDQLVVR